MYDDVIYAVDPQHVEGEMTIGVKQKSVLGEPEFNTLDEPIRDTIVRIAFYVPILNNCKLIDNKQIFLF